MRATGHTPPHTAFGLPALAFLFALVCGCILGQEESAPSGLGVEEEGEARPAIGVRHEQSAQAMVVAPDPQQEIAMATPKDPYAGARSWCEPMEYDRSCREHADCAEIDHVAGRPLRCVRPWWARGTDTRVCAPGYANTTERAWRRARQRELVAQLYTEEVDVCPNWHWEHRPGKKGLFVRVFANGLPIHKQHWRCQSAWRRGEKLSDFLWVPYLRETTARPWKRHRLSPDQRGSQRAWTRKAPSYGWSVDLEWVRTGKKKGYYALRGAEPVKNPHNPHYGQMERWHFGLGSYGQSAANAVLTWDRYAPPEILCHEVEATEVYLRKARGAVRIFRGSGVDCDGVRYHGRAIKGETELDEPSWMDVHRVASGGKFCPTKSKAMGPGFRKRMKSVGLDPDEPVSLSMLGASLPKETQNERAKEVLDLLDQLLPSPWRQDPLSVPVD